jgi:hypothetical protein
LRKFDRSQKREPGYTGFRAIREQTFVGAPVTAQYTPFVLDEMHSYIRTSSCKMDSERMNRFMMPALKKCRPVAITLGVAATLVAVGCGGDDSGLDRRYKVSGTVKYNGEPVEHGTITFEPTNPAPPAGRHASGYIEKGSYALTTSINGDGALPGEYKVLISSSTVDMRELAKKQGGMVHQGDEEFQKIVKNAKSLVPIKYAKAETTTEKAKVEAKAQTMDFDLKD